MAYEGYLGCILSKFYIKPQHSILFEYSSVSCILSKFYIKPQRGPGFGDIAGVVSYRNSTSNHNSRGKYRVQVIVVSYRNSTSNHNSAPRRKGEISVVSYRNSTSNHNPIRRAAPRRRLYLIEILHQTTTTLAASGNFSSCILSKFYIKPQLFASLLIALICCILSKFYIKPQRRASY